MARPLTRSRNLRCQVLFEVRVARDVLYVDETGTFIMRGNLINLQTGKNLTH